MDEETTIVSLRPKEIKRELWKHISQSMNDLIFTWKIYSMWWVCHSWASKANLEVH